MPTFIDTHAHLDDGRFDSDRASVLDRAAAAGVERILTIGIDLATSESAVKLANEHPHILRAVVGIQPNHVSEAGPSDFERIEQLAALTNVVAIGESGLDRYWDRAPFPMQEDYFRKHLALARRVNKPIVIHCREAEADVVRILKEDFDAHGPIRGVMHSFCGDAGTAEACLVMGLHISFAGMLTFKSSATLREVAITIPTDRVLVETDSPYLAPMPHRGKRNEPAFVAHTAAVLAEARGVSLALISEQTTRNARELFGLRAPACPNLPAHS